MPKVIEIPGVGNVEFPDSMSDGEISTAAKKAYEGTLPSAGSQIFTSLKNQAKGLFDSIVAAVPGLGASKQVEMGDALGQAQKDQFDKAKAAYQKGDYLSAVHHGLGAAVPILGPMIENTAEKLSTPGKEWEGATDLAVPLVSAGLAELPGLAPNATAALKAGVSAGGPDVAMGAIKTGGAAALAHSGPFGEVADALGAIPLGKSGIQQMVRGVKTAFSAGRDALAQKLEAGLGVVAPPPLADLDEIARSLGSKVGYEKLSDPARAAVDKIYAQMKAPQPQGAPSQVPAPPSQAPAPQPQGPVQMSPAGQRMAQSISGQPAPAAPLSPAGQRMSQAISGNPAPSQLSPAAQRLYDRISYQAPQAPADPVAVPANQPPVAPVPPEPKITVIPLKDTGPAKLANIAKAQFDRAVTVTPYLKQAGIDAADVANLTPDHWKMVGDAIRADPKATATQRAIGENLAKNPPSTETLKLIKGRLEAPAASKAQIDRLKKAGALKIAEDLADQLK